MNFMARIAGALFLCFALHGAAIAQASTLVEWRLAGRWAVDCASPPSRGNTHSSYQTRPDGSAFHTRNYGEGESAPNEILRASALGDGSILLLIDFPDLNHKRELVFARRADGRIQAFSNRELDGNYTVRDGRLVSGGAAMPWQTRCH